MLKIGDKVKVTYTNGDQFLGYLRGETPKMWKIEYDGHTGISRVLKTMDMVLVDDPETPELEVLEVPVHVNDYSKKQSRNLSWKLALLYGATILIAAFAILVGLDLLEVGATGIKFVF